MSEIAVEREGRGKNTQALEAEKESYTCCQVAKCVVPPSDWKRSVCVKQVVKDCESEFHYNGLKLNYKITSSD